jgi:Sec-independent protein secretion pathway component TatC
MVDKRLPQFAPLRPVDHGRLIAMFVLGPLVWLVAIVVAAVLVHRTFAIELGLIITFVSFVGFAVVLLAFYAGRRRQEQRAARR